MEGQSIAGVISCRRPTKAITSKLNAVVIMKFRSKETTKDEHGSLCFILELVFFVLSMAELFTIVAGKPMLPGEWLVIFAAASAFFHWLDGTGPKNP